MAVTDRRISRTVEGYLAEAENWKATHDVADDCLDFEELLALGNSIFDMIDRWDTVWHRKVHSMAIPFDAEAEGRIVALYRLWLGPADLMLAAIARFEAEGCEVAGAGAFRDRCGEARGLLIPDGEFFGPELIPHQEQALAEHRGGETSDFEESDDPA